MKDKPEFHYLVFSKRERRAILIWFLLIAAIKIIAYFYEDYLVRKNGNPKDWTKLIATIDSIEATRTSSNKKFNRFEERDFSRNTRNTSYRKPADLFEFDPNTASDDEWSALGVSDRTISGIKKYLLKGGRFRRAEDLRKVWGISDEHATALLPYVRIQLKDEPQADNFTHKIKASRVPGIIDINSSDSSQWEALPGIGIKLAARIIKFRERLGGFNSVLQVSETFGLADSTFQKIKPFLVFGGVVIKKIDINKATAEELKVHPYIRYQLANVIIQYRTQHGPFASVSDLQKIMIISEDQFNKMKPYLIAGE